MADPYTGEIRMLPYSFAPRDWAYCYGQLLEIIQFSSLYAVIGVNFGGDGQVSFSLPNLQAAAPMGQGQGPGMIPVTIGQRYGSLGMTLDGSNVPVHSHTLRVSFITKPEESAPGEHYLPHMLMSESQAVMPVYRTTPTNMTIMAEETLSYEGTGETFDNRQPCLGLNFCICLYGEFPPHS